MTLTEKINTGQVPKIVPFVSKSNAAEGKPVGFFYKKFFKPTTSIPGKLCFHRSFSKRPRQESRLPAYPSEFSQTNWSPTKNFLNYSNKFVRDSGMEGYRTFKRMNSVPQLMTSQEYTSLNKKKFASIKKKEYGKLNKVWGSGFIRKPDKHRQSFDKKGC
jgi:hypothetical protein